MSDKFAEAREALISKLCRTMSRTMLIDMAKTIHDLPVPDTHKQSILLTVITTMLSDTLDSFYEDHMDADELLKKKLEFMRIIRGSYIEQHKHRQKKEKRNDNG